MPRLPLLLAGLVVVAAGCSNSAEECDRLPGVRPGVCIADAAEREPAPTLPGPELGGDEGDELTVAGFEGQPLVVNFWGSWCGPCRVEQPELNDVAERFDDEAAFLGVNVTDATADARAYQAEFDVPYPSIFDPNGRFAAEFGGIGPNVMPSTLVLDADGRVAVRLFGSTTDTELTVLLDRLLAEG